MPKGKNILAFCIFQCIYSVVIAQTGAVIKDSLLLKEVQVKGSRPYIEAVQGKTVLNVDRSITASGMSALDIIRRAPGIVTGSGSGISMANGKGVTVMVDGKPLNFSSAEMNDYLAGMNGDLIHKIEIMSHPPSDRDAGGSGGIIDIRLKENRTTGTNGSLTAGTGYGRNHKLNTAVSFNHRQKLFNIYGSWAFTDNKRAERYHIDRNVYSDRLNTGFDLDNYDLKSFSNHNYKGGIDFFPGQSHTIGLMYTGMRNHMFSGEDNRTVISHNFTVDSAIVTRSDETRDVINHAVNLNYKASLKSGGSIGVDADYFNYNRRSHEYLEYTFHRAEGGFYRDPLTLDNHTPSDIVIRSVRAEYSGPLSSKATLKTGIKSSEVSSKNDRAIDAPGQEAVLPVLFTSDAFSYRETIHAAWLSYASTSEKSDLQLGLRGEYTRSSGRSSADVPVTKRYFSLFPFLGYSLKLHPEHKVSLQYSRRIGRPAYDDLNPFIYFLDQYTYREGNPYLRPEYSNSLELSDVYKNKLNITASADHVKDYYLTFTEQNDTTLVSRSLKRNLLSERSVGLALNYTEDVSDWLNTVISMEGYYRQFNLRDAGLRRNSTLFTFSSINTCTLMKGLNAELTFKYESPTVSGMFNFKSVYMLDAGIGKSVLNDRGRLRFSVSDILNSDRNRYGSDLMNLHLYARQKMETRIARLNFNYRFGRKAVTPARNRATGNDQEAKRVNN